MNSPMTTDNEAAAVEGLAEILDAMRAASTQCAEFAGSIESVLDRPTNCKIAVAPATFLPASVSLLTAIACIQLRAKLDGPYDFNAGSLAKLKAAIAAHTAASAGEAKPTGAAQQALTGKYGDVLRPFVVAMEAELHANAGKGDRPGWLAMSAQTALLEIYYHLAKLQKAVRNEGGPLIQEYAADVANMSMMLLDICGGLALIGDDPSAPPPAAVPADALERLVAEWRDQAKRLRNEVPNLRDGTDKRFDSARDADRAADELAALIPKGADHEQR